MKYVALAHINESFRLHFLFCAAGVLFFAMSIAWAQVSSGAIRGTVTDTTMGIIPGVTVTASNEATGIEFSTVTNDAGIYTFPVLPIGTYSLAAELVGFRRAVQRGIELQVNQTARIDLVLHVGELSEEMTIHAQAVLLEQETSSLGQVVGERQIGDLPLNSRNYFELTTLIPGVNFGAAGAIGGGTRPDDPRPGSAVFVHGTRESSNTFLVDGIDNYDRVHTTIGVRPSLDAVQEFKVQTSMYSAEFGRNAGGVISIVIKSGSNALRGSLYQFHRNKALDARHFFSPSTEPKPHFLYNQFGGTLGGPIVRNRTFFFGSYEGFRLRRGETFISTVPTEAMRNGDFGGLAPIFDPFSSPITQFPNNVIPRERWDPAAARLIELYPLPNLPGVASNFVHSPVREQNTDQIDTRIDHQFGPNSNLFGRYSFGDTDTITPAFLPGKGQGGGGFSGPNVLRTQNVAIGYTHTVTPSLVSETRLGYSRIRSTVEPFFFGENLSEEAGIPGANADRASSGLTTIAITGFRGLGNSGFMPIRKFVNTYQITENINYSRGRHIIKVGTNIVLPQTNHLQTANAAGRFAFNANFTRNPEIPGGGHAIASFLLGYPSATSRTAQMAPNYGRWVEFGGYIQDDWKVHQSLTLNLGLRYELITPMTSVNDHMSNFDFEQGRVVIAGIDTTRTAGIKTDRNNFGPRVGFAWSVTPRTVLRSGYGVFYDSVPLFAQLRPFPFQIQHTISPAIFTPENRMSDGFPAPDFDIEKNAANPFGTIDAVPFDNPVAYVQQFNLNIQQSLTNDTVFSVAYVGTLGRKLRWVYDENVPEPGPGSVQERRPYFDVVPNVVGIRTNHAEASSAYHSFQASVQRRFSQGFSYQGSYTWSHWIDDAISETGYGSQGVNPQDIRNRRAERGPDPADIRQRFVFSTLYELPFGRGRRWASEGNLASMLLGGWQVNGIFSAQSGLPFSVTLASAVSNTGTGNRPDRIADGRLSKSERNIDRWFDTSAFQAQPLFTFGNSGRNILRGPGYVNLDLSVFRAFNVGEVGVLQFRTEFFNMTNTPRFGLPSGSLGSGGFGQIRSLAGDMRQIQFGLKFQF